MYYNNIKYVKRFSITNLIYSKEKSLFEKRQANTRLNLAIDLVAYNKNK